MEYIYELAPTRKAVWVHASDGSTVGRFGRMGIDIHTSITEQMAGSPECRLCTHAQVSEEDWSLFRSKAKEFWGLDIPADGIDLTIFAH